MLKRLVTACILCLAISQAPLAHAKGATRVVSLKPSITDTVYALGLGDRLVGITKYCDVPEGAPRPAIAADYTRPYSERIIALRPDVVLGSEENSSRKSIEALRRAGISVELFPFTTFAETLVSIEGVARALGVPKRGKELRRGIESRLENLKRRHDGESTKRVVVIWGLRPMIAAGSGTYMDEAMKYIGLENAARGTKVRYPKIGLEQLISFDPDVIIDLSMDAGKGSGKERPWDGIDAIKAVKGGRVVAMEPAAFRAGPNLPASLERLAKEIGER